MLSRLPKGSFKAGCASFALAAVVALSSPATAQSQQERLAELLTGTNDEVQLSFSFGVEACIATVSTTYPVGDTAMRTDVATFPMEDLRIEGLISGTSPLYDAATIQVPMLSDAEPAHNAITITNDTPDNQAGWEALGAICDAEYCRLDGEVHFVTFHVQGPIASERAENAIQDIRALASSCATNQ